MIITKATLKSILRHCGASVSVFIEGNEYLPPDYYYKYWSAETHLNVEIYIDGFKNFVFVKVLD